MEDKKIRCCICGKVIRDAESCDPAGALDEHGHMIKWKKEDRCCNDCNNSVVIAGRLSMYFKK